jgi:hypothetical protein
MSDQHAAATLTAAAAIALILITRAAVLRSGRKRTAGSARPRCQTRHPTGPAARQDDAAGCAVREAEQYVQRCWRHLQTHTDRPD